MPSSLACPKNLTHRFSRKLPASGQRQRWEALPNEAEVGSEIEFDDIKNLLIARSKNLNDSSKIQVLLENRADVVSAARVSLTALGQTSMLVCRGEVREFGLTGLTRNQVSLTAPGVRIPPSPPHSLSYL